MQNTNIVLIPTKANRARIAHHFTIIQKLGYSAGVKCWCGEKWEPAYREKNIQQKRKAFFDVHDECAGPGETP